MRLRITVLVPLLVLVGHLAHGQAAPDTLEMEPFLRQAWSATNRARAGRAELEAALAVRRQATAQRLPTVALEMNGGWVSRTQELAMPGGRVEFGDGSSVDAALTSVLTLYSGGALRAGEMAAAAQAVAREQDLIADSLRLAGELRSAFLDALAADAALEASGVALERLIRHREDLSVRVQAGMAGEEALLLTESRLLAQRQDGELRRSGLRRAQLELGSLVGRPGEGVVARGRIEEELPGLRDEERRHAELSALDARLTVAAALVEQRKAAVKPRVEAGAGWHLARPGVDPIANDWMGYGSAALRLRWTLWDGRLNRLRVEEARHTRRALEHRLDDAERRASATLAAAREGLRATRAAWEHGVARCSVEERRLTLMESRWRQGLATERDWLDVLDDLRLARLDRAMAASRLRLAENHLLLALGR